MMFLRKAMLIWMVVWLPFAGATAAVMPITGTTQASLSKNSIAGAEAAPSAESSGGELPMPCHDKAASGKASTGQSCSHCVLCHLAGALALGTMPVMPQVPPTHVFDSTPLLPHPSFVPDLPKPPPRASLA